MLKNPMKPSPRMSRSQAPGLATVLDLAFRLSDGVRARQVPPHDLEGENPMTDFFPARDLDSVLSRHRLPVTVMTVMDVRYEGVHAVSSCYSDMIHLLDGEDVVLVTLDGADMICLSEDAVVLEDAPDGVLAYGCDGEILCARHGAPMDHGIPDGDVWPIFGDGGDDLAPVEYCTHVWDAGDRGHSFCGSCGQDLEMARGAHDRDVEGPFTRCWNCGTTSVYVDGEGYSWVDGFKNILTTHEATVRGIEAYCQTDLNGETRVSAINADNVPHDMLNLKIYAAWQDLDPSVGTLLILAEDEDEAEEVADEWSQEQVDLSEFPEDEHEGVLSDQQAGLQVRTVDIGKVDFSTRRTARV
jgi:hypothetical protein